MWEQARSLPQLRKAHGETFQRRSIASALSCRHGFIVSSAGDVRSSPQLHATRFRSYERMAAVCGNRGLDEPRCRPRRYLSASGRQERVGPTGAPALHARACRAAASPVFGKDERAERVSVQRHPRRNTEPSRYREELRSAGASLGRANAGFVKLIAPVLLRSAPKVLRLARRGAVH
jgi:hypothetical protein